MSLNIAFIGVVNGLFAAMRAAGRCTGADLASRLRLDPGYVGRWCDAAFAFGFLEADAELFELSSTGSAMCPDAPDTLMPTAIQAVLSAHMAERAAELMRTGRRPGESVLAERQTILPWFGPMLEASFTPIFENQICTAVAAFAQADASFGLVVDLGCGNGWYLRALARRFPRLRGLGIDGFEENVQQAQHLARQQCADDRLRFVRGDIHQFALGEPAALIAMNRALHHVWEKDPGKLFIWLHDNLGPGGHAVVWEPAWPDERSALRDPARRPMAFQNLSEHVQGNHFLRPREIVEAFAGVGMPAQVHLFADGNEAVIVARREP